MGRFAGDWDCCSMVVWTHGPWFSNKLAHAFGKGRFPLGEVLLTLEETALVLTGALTGADNHRVAAHRIAPASWKWSASS